jgi:hypothetical protein
MGCSHHEHARPLQLRRARLKNALRAVDGPGDPLWALRPVHRVVCSGGPGFS